MAKKVVLFWNVPVERPLDDALEAAVAIDWHRTKSEFIRDTVRQRLKEMGFKPPRPEHGFVVSDGDDFPIQSKKEVLK